MPIINYSHIESISSNKNNAEKKELRRIQRKMINTIVIINGRVENKTNSRRKMIYAKNQLHSSLIYIVCVRLYLFALAAFNKVIKE